VGRQLTPATKTFPSGPCTADMLIAAPPRGSFAPYANSPRSFVSCAATPLWLLPHLQLEQPLAPLPHSASISKAVTWIRAARRQGLPVILATTASNYLPSPRPPWQSADLCGRKLCVSPLRSISWALLPYPSNQTTFAPPPCETAQQRGSPNQHTSGPELKVSCCSVPIMVLRPASS
jgi:hypothetical protein